MARAFDPAADRDDRLRTVAWVVGIGLIGALIGLAALALTAPGDDAPAVHVGRAG